MYIFYLLVISEVIKYCPDIVLDIFVSLHRSKEYIFFPFFFLKMETNIFMK